MHVEDTAQLRSDVDIRTIFPTICRSTICRVDNMTVDIRTKHRSQVKIYDSLVIVICAASKVWLINDSCGNLETHLRVYVHMYVHMYELRGLLTH
jgi:hypothetical protein